jgi:hypothetical protein
MAKQKALCRAANGLFVRNLGWKRTPTGYAQHKFYLGREEVKATLASLRLQQLWDQVSRRWQRENATELEPTDRPVWDGVTLAVAEAIRNGEAVARVPLPLPLAAMVPESPLRAEWLHRLQSDLTVIQIELRDAHDQQQSEDQIRKEGERLIALGRGMLHAPPAGRPFTAPWTPTRGGSPPNTSGWTTGRPPGAARKAARSPSCAARSRTARWASWAPHGSSNSSSCCVCGPRGGTASR